MPVHESLKQAVYQPLENRHTPRIAYDIHLEIEEYQRLCQLEGTIPPGEHAQKLLAWRQEKILNQQTNLGERYNAKLFEVDYPVENDRLINPFRNEYMLDSLTIGQQKRLSKNLNHDDKRELVELTTFSAVESYFVLNSNTLIVPSPPGGSFGNNYIDVFSPIIKDGRKFVKMQRFPTDLTLNKHWQVAQKLTSEKIDQQAESEQDIQIKTLVIETTQTTDQLRMLYTQGRNTTSTEKYQELKRVVDPLINNYIDSIIKGAPISVVQANHNSIIKSADIFMGKDTDQTRQITRDYLRGHYNTAHIAAVLGQQETITVKTGCGLQSGLSSKISKTNLISSSLFLEPQNNLFSLDTEDKSDFPCPQCGHIIIYGSGTKQCPGCGLEATCG